MPMLPKSFTLLFLFFLCKLLIQGQDYAVLIEIQACYLWNDFASYNAVESLVKIMSIL